MRLAYYNGFSPKQREAAGVWKRWAVKRGLYVHPTTCVACGSSGGIVDGHWEDYSPPFSQEKDIPLCLRCHLFVHWRFRHAEAWDRYRAEIRQGWRYAPLRERNFGAFIAQNIACSQPVHRTMHDPPTRFWLDEIHEGKLDPRQRAKRDRSLMPRDDALTPLHRDAKERLLSLRDQLERHVSKRRIRKP